MNIRALAVLVMSLTACGPPPPAQMAPVTKFVPAVLERLPVKVFPEAASVRLTIHDKGYTEDGKPIYSNPNGTLLTSAQRTALDAAFTQVREVKPAIVPPDYEGPMASAPACFVPHHHFAFLSAAGKTVGHLDVCFCCTGAQFDRAPTSSPPDAWIVEDMDALKRLVADMGLPTDVSCD